MFEGPVSDGEPAGAAGAPSEQAPSEQAPSEQAPSPAEPTVPVAASEPLPVEVSDDVAGAGMAYMDEAYTGEARTYGAVPPATPPPMARTAPAMGATPLTASPGAHQAAVAFDEPDVAVGDPPADVSAWIPPEEAHPEEAAPSETAPEAAVDESDTPSVPDADGPEPAQPPDEVVPRRPFVHEAGPPPVVDPPMIIPIRAYYMTRADDTLRSIAAQFLNTPSRWQELRSLNAGYPGIADSGPDSILPVGSSIALPGDPLPWGKPDPVYLWTLAEKFLFAAWGREPSPDEVVPFWRGLTGGAQHLAEGPSQPPAIGDAAAAPAEPPIPPAMQPPAEPHLPDEEVEQPSEEPPPAEPAAYEPPVPAEPAAYEPPAPAEPVVYEPPPVEPAAYEPPPPVDPAVNEPPPVPAEPVVYEPPPVPVEPAAYEPPVPAEPVVYEPPAPAEPVVYEPPAPAEPVVYEPPVPVEPAAYEPPVPAEPVVYEPPAPAEPVVYEPPVPAEPVVYEPPPVPVEPAAYEPPVPVEPVVYEPPPVPVEPAVYEPPVPVEPVVYEPPPVPAEPVVYEPPPVEPAAHEPPTAPATEPPAYRPPSTPVPGHEPVRGMPDLGPLGSPESPESEADTSLPAFMPSLTGTAASADVPVEQVVEATARRRVLAGTAIGDAMLLWQLGRLRRHHPKAVESAPHPLEVSLQQTARMDSLRLIEAAMRQLRAVTVAQFKPKPSVVCVRTGTYGFEVLLDQPVEVPEGWQGASGGYVLELRRDVTIEYLDAAGRGPSLCPALVPVGDTAEGPLLLNLEEVGCLAVSGPVDASVSLLGSVVEMLGSSPLAGNVRIITVGVGSLGGPGWERIHALGFDSPQLEHLLSTALSPAHAGDDSLIDVLVVGPGNDILFQRAGQVAASPGSRLVLVGATSSPTARWPWRIQMDEQHRAVVHPIAVNITATQAMRPELAHLLSEAAEGPNPASRL